MSDLLALAERCEREEASRDLDIQIACLCGLLHRSTGTYYTASLDAAVTLVPEGFVWGASNLCGPTAHVVGEEDADGNVPTGDSDAASTKSVPLALCAAALRARAALANP